MRRIRIQRQKVRHRAHEEVVLPPDPRDPDVVRAKRLQRGAEAARRAQAA